MPLTAEQEFWLALYAAFMGIAKAIKRYKLGGTEPQPVTVSPSDSIAGAVATSEPIARK